jgi:uncharacterized protein (TIGR00369 family)
MIRYLVTPDQVPQEARITAEGFETLISTTMDLGMDFRFKVEELAWGFARLRLHPSERHLRPGATISGPTLFTLADTALYAAVLACVGNEPLTVTTDMSIHFLRRAPAGALLAEARVLKAGRQLLHGDIVIRSEVRDGIVCHATGSYAKPPGPSLAVKTAP